MNINLTFCTSCPSGYTVEDIEDMQKAIDKKIATVVNKEYRSKRNDLGYCLDEESYTKLVWLNDILEQIKSCNSCYEEFSMEGIANLIKDYKNKLR